MSGPLTYSPPVPDGPDRPWTRGRLTRWWLVVPADLVTVALVSLFATASLHDSAPMRGLLAAGAAAVVVAWAVAWVVRRGRDHLEVLWPEGGIVVGTTWAVWAASVTVLGVDVGPLGSFAVMLLTFLVVFQSGWRCLYGYAKAHESMIPKPVQRRLDAQARSGTGDSDEDARTREAD